ncbi:MAG: TolB family protein, partial [Steroidobacteraceae bacterium]
MDFLRPTVALIALWSLSIVSASAAELRRFSVEDLVRLKRVSEPALSPDGRTLAFTVRETDMEANRGRQDLWSLDLATKGTQPRRLTTHPENDNAPEWSADGRDLYFLSSRSGSSQVWRLAAGGGEAEQVTKLPLDVGTFRLAPDNKHLAVTLEVFAQCGDLDCTQSRLKQASASKASGVVHDRIFARHWDTWSDG